MQDVVVIKFADKWCWRVDDANIFSNDHNNYCGCPTIRLKRRAAEEKRPRWSGLYQKATLLSLTFFAPKTNAK
jgi:hypothetical protein